MPPAGPLVSEQERGADVRHAAGSRPPVLLAVHRPGRANQTEGQWHRSFVRGALHLCHWPPARSPTGGRRTTSRADGLKDAQRDALPSAPPSRHRACPPAHDPRQPRPKDAQRDALTGRTPTAANNPHQRNPPGQPERPRNASSTRHQKGSQHPRIPENTTRSKKRDLCEQAL